MPVQSTSVADITVAPSLVAQVKVPLPIVPVSPLGPVCPVGPVDPVGPVVHVGPVEPVDPVIHVEPVVPVGPVAPVAPFKLIPAVHGAGNMLFVL